MKYDKHVYCTDCINFRLCDENIPYCMFENDCDINNPEDSVAYSIRKHFESK